LITGYHETTNTLKTLQQAIKKHLEDTERIIVFIDLVGSTRFKIEYSAEPWIWIARLSLFYQILSKSAKQYGGTVVKFIGDEAMISFDGSRIEAAVNLITSIATIEDEMQKRTGRPAKIKIAADIGHVYEFNIIEHGPPDPQGTPTDRCARIAKRCLPGQVLVSQELYQRLPATEKNSWTFLASEKAHGLGFIGIYILGTSLSETEPTIEAESGTTDNLTPFQKLLRERLLPRQNDEAAELEQQGTKTLGTQFASMMERELDNLGPRGTVLALCGEKKLLGNEPTYYGYFYRFAKDSFDKEGKSNRIRVCRLFMPGDSGFTTVQDEALKGHSDNETLGVRGVRIPASNRQGILDLSWSEAIRRFNSEYGFGYVVLIEPSRGAVGYTHEADLKSKNIKVCEWKSDRTARELIQIFRELLVESEWTAESSPEEENIRQEFRLLLYNFSWSAQC
jgi:class 3 adenylate cyclase